MSTPAAPAALDSKKLAELQVAGPSTLAQAQEMKVIDNAEDYLASGVLLERVDERQRYWTAFFDKPTRDAFSVHKWITGMRSSLLAPYIKAENLLKEARKKYRAEEERKRLEREELERQTSKVNADQQAIEEAARMEEIGEHEAAETIIDRAAIAPPPPVIVPSTVPKEQGHSFRTVYKYRVTNPALHKREFLILDESKTGVIVSRLGPDAAALVGGIEVYPEEQEIVRRKNEQ